MLAGVNRQRSSRRLDAARDCAGVDVRLWPKLGAFRDARRRCDKLMMACLGTTLLPLSLTQEPLRNPKANAFERGSGTVLSDDRRNLSAAVLIAIVAGL